MDILVDITPKVAEDINGNGSDENNLPERSLECSNRDHPINLTQLRVIQTLGEGAFGEVKLLVDKNDPSITVAVKYVDLKKHHGEYQAVRREALLHRLCSGHKNVLEYITMKNSPEEHFQLFMEYVDGGELFDQIEPDVGIPAERARFYFAQLLDGLEFIHSKGVVHRDIKPENLLLTRSDVLKICDFGMATIFRHNGKERMLDTPCGSMPYVAPELLKEAKYRAEPIDIWSAGVVLVTLLVGELPWEEPHMNCKAYKVWAENKELDHLPWSRIDTRALSLLKLVLHQNPAKRANILRIRRHPWLNRRKSDSVDLHPPLKFPRLLDHIVVSQPAFLSSLARSDPPSVKTMGSLDCSNESIELSRGMDTASDLEATADSDEGCANLPTVSPPLRSAPIPSHISSIATTNFSFSQPAENAETLFISQQTQTQTMEHFGNRNVQEALQKLCRRMTRFCLVISIDEAVDIISRVLNSNGFNIKQPVPGQIVATSLVGQNKSELVMMATVYEIFDQRKRRVLADFRRSRGDGIQFKRLFVLVRKCLIGQICAESYAWMAHYGLMELSKLRRLKLDSTSASGGCPEMIPEQSEELTKEE